MLGNYTNQNLVWKHVTGVDKYNQPTYATPITIKGRKEKTIKIVRNSYGVEVVSTAQIVTGSDIRADDLVDGIPVIVVSDAVNLKGTVIFRRVYL